MESALYLVSTQHPSPCWRDFDGDPPVVWGRLSSAFSAPNRKGKIRSKKRRKCGGPVES